MINNIRLFIGDRELDGLGDIDILFNKELTDFTNPTVVQNSYTKTISIPGTKNNNDVFGHFFQLDRIQLYNGNTGPSYNPSYRVPFTLYVNGDIYESGYMKLEEIRRNKKDITYDICLYGGLGQFLYNLDMDWATGEKKKLSDLHYMWWDNETPSADEFNFTINKETLDEFWQNGPNVPGGSEIYDYINFAPCYNGIPEDISSDKVLVNTSGSTAFTGSITASGTTYSAWHGYALGELPEEMTEWETKDLRSYNQRPVLSLKRFLDAIAQPENNKGEYDTGYTVDMSDIFFNPVDLEGVPDENPYVNDAWITLPMLSENKDETEGGTPVPWTPTVIGTSTYNGDYNTTYAFQSGIPVATNSATINFEFMVRVRIAKNKTAPQKLYTSAKWNSTGDIDMGGWAIQLVAGNSDATMYGTGDVVGGSDILHLTSSYDTQRLDIQGLIANGHYQPAYPANIQESVGYFVYDHKETGSASVDFDYGYYKWYQPIILSCAVPADAVKLAVRINQIANITYVTTGTGKNKKTSPTFGYRRGALYDTQNLISDSSKYGVTQDKVWSFKGITGTYYTKTDGVFSGAKITKAKLLNTDYSPCDLLLSYAKMFGLYFEKDKFENKIYIRSRQSFYDRENIVNISDIIDHDKDAVITPIVADSAYYNMTTEPTDENLQFISAYQKEYGKTYGMKTIKTGFNFDASSKELLEDSCLFGTVDALEKGRYYYRELPHNVAPYIYNGVNYTLPKNGDIAADKSFDMSVNKRNMDTFEAYNSVYKNYDLFVKPQFHDSKNEPLDGAATLLLYNGRINLPGGSSYWLTDDLSEMGQLNGGESCWLYTESEYGYQGKKIAIHYGGFNVKYASTGEYSYLPDGEYELDGFTGETYLDITDFDYAYFHEAGYGPYMFPDGTYSLKNGMTFTVQSGRLQTQTMTMPVYQRYRANWNYDSSRQSGFITHSFDFGDPRKLYVPFYANKTRAHIYDAYWNAYLSDLYDVNTKQLSVECYAKEMIDESWFKKFFWYENTIWRLNKITDYNVASYDTTRLEFIKVENLDNYSNRTVHSRPDYSLKLYYSNGVEVEKMQVPWHGRNVFAYVIPNTGATYYCEIIASDGGGWTTQETIDSHMHGYLKSGKGDANFDIQFDSNYPDSEYIFEFAIEDDYDSWHRMYMVYKQPASLSVEPQTLTFNATGGTKTIVIDSEIDWVIE